jgi:hypothetical protein
MVRVARSAVVHPRLACRAAAAPSRRRVAPHGPGPRTRGAQIGGARSNGVLGTPGRPRLPLFTRVRKGSRE